ncbi:MAG: oligopeptide/dipeptide transporter, ATPase subunit [Haloplasmataceae bacterium]|jgi:oligopeptide transport system ATP-binding protein|nr:oligopeptide/dipeptide transporter, ATPase subunit [Haloplasmataceae bacterium]
MDENILEVKNVKKYFTKSEGIFGGRKLYVKAVDNVSFSIKKGETFGLVGESGCGKSTLGRSIIRLYDITDGEIFFKGQRIATGSMLNKKAKKHKPDKILMTKMQLIFQDPYASLNPRMTVADIISEPLFIADRLSGEKSRRVKRIALVKNKLKLDILELNKQQNTDDIEKIKKIKDLKQKAHDEINRVRAEFNPKERVNELLSTVGLNREHASRYPHEFSGGQRQRIGIARALAVNPEFIVCDEPISALDVSIQAQVINLLEELQEKLGLTYLFIAHDLSMVKHISDRIAVMYLGKIVEVANSDELFENTLHPYTKALLSSVPVPDINKEKLHERQVIEGEIPSPLNPPSGCRFRTRCKYATERCTLEEPLLKEHGEGHIVACHLLDE